MRQAVVVAVIVMVLGLGAWTQQRRLVYFPSTGSQPAAGEVLPRAEDVVLRTADGLSLGAWFVPAAGRDRGATVLVANGNGGDRSGRAPLAKALAAEGLSVLLMDYRGYGDSEGSPSEAGLALDIRAARSYLVDERGVRPDRLIYLGESLGSAVVVELATEHPPAAMLLRSPFVDLPSVGRHHYPLLPARALLWDEYPVAENLRQVDVPVTVVLGTSDSVVPAEQSREVATSAPVLVELVEVAGVDHDDRALLDGEELVAAVVRLADGLG